jgi:biotin transport system substrate-specific component
MCDILLNGKSNSRNIKEYDMSSPSSNVVNGQLTTLAPIVNSSLAKQLLLVVGGSFFVAGMSQVAVGYPIPTTLQTLAVMLIGLTFGFRLATATLLLYLFEGVVGIPVFAKFSFGWEKIVGPSGGYLVGFLLAAALIGYLADRGFTKSWIGTIVALILGEAIIFGLGVAQLSHALPDLVDPIKVGFTDFILVDLIKVALAVLISKGVLKGASRFAKL